MCLMLIACDQASVLGAVNDALAQYLPEQILTPLAQKNGDKNQPLPTDIDAECQRHAEAAFGDLGNAMITTLGAQFDNPDDIPNSLLTALAAARELAASDQGGGRLPLSEAGLEEILSQLDTAIAQSQDPETWAELRHALTDSQIPKVGHFDRLEFTRNLEEARRKWQKDLPASLQSGPCAPVFDRYLSLLNHVGEPPSR